MGGLVAFGKAHGVSSAAQKSWASVLFFVYHVTQIVELTIDRVPGVSPALLTVSPIYFSGKNPLTDVLIDPTAKPNPILVALDDPAARFALSSFRTKTSKLHTPAAFSTKRRPPVFLHIPEMSSPR